MEILIREWKSQKGVFDVLVNGEPIMECLTQSQVDELTGAEVTRIYNEQKEAEKSWNLK